MMTWDAWPVAIVVMTLLVMVRPGWASFALRQNAPKSPHRHALMQAGGGTAMLTMAVYLETQFSHVTGRGYWDMPLLAINAPFMRTLPSVWIPTLCWALLAVLGTWWMFAGARVRGPRDMAAFVWALNEAAIMSSLMLWNVYAPEQWSLGSLMTFTLKGIYVSCLVGAVVRLMMAGVGMGAVPPAADSKEHRGMAQFGRMRRY